MRGDHVRRPEHAAQAARLGRVNGLRVPAQGLGVAPAAAPPRLQARRLPHHMTGPLLVATPPCRSAGRGMVVTEQAGP